MRRATFPRLAALLLGACMLAASACAPDSVPPAAQTPLGPVDGHDLPAVDTGRVAVGDPAPDFRLETFRGPVVQLSEFRGRKDVILVFYRGHW